MDVLKSYYEISPFFFVVTASASFLYMTMNLIMIFGGGHDDFDHHPSADVTFKFFSLQTTLAFLMGFGWAGITSTVKWKLPMFPSVLISIGFGAVLMGFTAFLMFRVKKLNHTTTANLYSSLGTKAKVYSTIPLPEEGVGKIQVVVSGSLKIVSAISSEESIDSFTEVEVIGVKDKDTLIVKKIVKPSSSGESA